MARPVFRIILDTNNTNTLLRGLAAGASAAARVRRAAEQRVIVPLLSKPIIDEYRAVLTDREVIERFPEITPELVEITIRRLRFIGEYLRAPTSRFQYRRDPDDQKFIELAIELHATHILSFDEDLLSLPRSRGEAGRRFRQRLPRVEIQKPVAFLEEHGSELGIA